jgi:hypothetical protein
LTELLDLRGQRKLVHAVLVLQLLPEKLGSLAMT